MLVISRRKGQRITIGDEIELVVTELHRSSVKLGIRAPKGYAVLRGEVRDSIEEANRQAAETVLEGVELGEPTAAPATGKAPTDLLRVRQPAGEAAAASTGAAPVTGEPAAAGPEVIVRRRPPGTPPTGSTPNETETP
jgi:carbon storage regulator